MKDSHVLSSSFTSFKDSSHEEEEENDERENNENIPVKS